MNTKQEFCINVDILRVKSFLKQYNCLEEEILVIHNWQLNQLFDNKNIVVSCMLCICMQGSITFKVDKSQYKVIANDIFIFPPGQEITEIVTSSNFVLSGIMVSDNLIKKTDMFLLFLKNFQNMPVFPYSKDRVMRMKNLLNEIDRNLNKDSLMLLSLQILYSLYCIYIKNGNPPFAPLDIGNKKNNYQSIINCFHIFVLKNHNGEINLSTCCTELKISTKTLNRAFHFQNILSPKKCLLQLLICDIEDQLLDSSILLMNIEANLGIKKGHLCHIFRKYVGMTPSEYRKRYSIF